MRKYLSHLSSIVKLVIDDMSVNLNVPIRSNLVHQKISGFPRILCDTKNTKVSSVSRAKWSKLPPMAICLLISTLISENQGLLQTLEKFQVLQTWIFFLVYHLDFFHGYGINLTVRWYAYKIYR